MLRDDEKNMSLLEVSYERLKLYHIIKLVFSEIQYSKTHLSNIKSLAGFYINIFLKQFV